MYQVKKGTEELDLTQLGQILLSFQTNEQVKLDKYKNYYDGKMAIQNKQPSDVGKPANKITLNYCEVIAD